MVVTKYLSDTGSAQRRLWPGKVGVTQPSTMLPSDLGNHVSGDRRFLTRDTESSDTNNSLPSQNDGIPCHCRLEEILFVAVIRYCLSSFSTLDQGSVRLLFDSVQPAASSCQKQRLRKLVTTFQQCNTKITALGCLHLLYTAGVEIKQGYV